MNETIYYAHYSRTLKRNLNRLEKMTPENKIRHGVFIKIKRGDLVGFADYFPHELLGDLSVEHFLDTFLAQNEISHKKCYHFAKQELNKDFLTEYVSFLNHQFLDLNMEESALPLDFKGKVFKIKLSHILDAKKINTLFKHKNDFQIRLDANGLFTKDTFRSFYELLNPEIISNIEYIEDPSHLLDWSWISSVNLSAAEDFISGTPASIKIYKPNREFWDANDSRKKIFSSYQGSELGQWHAYQELIKYGDLSLYHGVEQQNLYVENLDLFQKRATPVTVKKMYQSLHSLDWKLLGVNQ